MWSIEFLNQTVLDELNKQPVDIRARFERTVKLIQNYGLNQIGMPHVRSLQNSGLSEIRMRGRDRIARAIFTAEIDQRIIILRVFTKASQKTPKRELDLALRRRKEII